MFLQKITKYISLLLISFLVLNIAGQQILFVSLGLCIWSMLDLTNNGLFFVIMEW